MRETCRLANRFSFGRAAPFSEPEDSHRALGAAAESLVSALNRVNTGIVKARGRTRPKRSRPGAGSGIGAEAYRLDQRRPPNLVGLEQRRQFIRGRRSGLKPHDFEPLDHLWRGQGHAQRRVGALQYVG